MNPEPELACDARAPMTAPSVDFITAISEFFETDPSDLLVELGYYTRDEEVSGLVD